MRVAAAVLNLQSLGPPIPVPSEHEDFGGLGPEGPFEAQPVIGAAWPVPPHSFGFKRH